MRRPSSNASTVNMTKATRDLLSGTPVVAVAVMVGQMSDQSKCTLPFPPSGTGCQL